jgi:VanZ family protein
VTGGGALRRFDRPGLWLGLWLFGWVLCVVLSLIHPPQLGVDVPDGDKVGHFLAYGLLSAWAVWLFPAWRAQGAAALALVALGVAREFAQGAWTTDRMMDWRDALADAVGVALGLWLARARAPDLLLRLEARWWPRPRRAR